MDSTSTIWCISNLALFETSAAGVLKDFFVGSFGATNFLLILLLFACFGLFHLRNRLRESEDRERTFERAIAALKTRAEALEERLRLWGDRSELVAARAKIIDERDKIIEQRNLLIDQKLAVGEELLRLMNERRALVRFRSEGFSDTLYKDILFVDDERALHSAKEAIEAEFPGLRVRVASNGAEALAAVKTRQPSLLITDLIMPVLDGFQLIGNVRDNYPDIAVLAISSYVDNAAQIIAKIGSLPARFELLPKPAPIEMLLDAVNRLTIRETDWDIRSTAAI
jgi:CheY-like chemotaxis protein